MPTNPVEDLLPRKTDDPAVENILRRFSLLIDESVNFGTHVFKWCCDATDGSDENIPLVLSLRHILDLLDSVSTLVRQGSADPCKLLLRGALESFLAIKYILHKESRERALAFMYCHYWERKKLYRKMDPSAKEGKDFRKLLARDVLVGDTVSIPNLPDLSKAVENIDALLKKRLYANAEAEFRRLRKERKGTPRWYTFYDGPKDLRDLAIHLGLPGLYEILYRSWSGSTHGTDIIQGRIARIGGDETGIVQIRFPKGMQELVSISLSLSFNAYRGLIEFYVPERRGELNSWYLKEMQPWCLKLSSQELLVVKSD